MLGGWGGAWGGPPHLIPHPPPRVYANASRWLHHHFDLGWNPVPTVTSECGASVWAGVSALCHLSLPGARPLSLPRLKTRLALRNPLRGDPGTGTQKSGQRPEGGCMVWWGAVCVPSVSPGCCSPLAAPCSPPATCPQCSDAALTSGDQQPHASHPWHPIRLSHRPTPVPADTANPGNANRRHRLSTTDLQLENGSAESRGGPWVPAQPRGPTALGQGSQPARRTLCPRHPTPGWAAVFTTDP